MGVLAPGSAHARPSFRPRNLIFIGILLFLLLRTPCKISLAYDNTFYGFNNGTKKRKEEEEERKICKILVCLSCSAGAHMYE
jgi:hypothetical protein